MSELYELFSQHPRISTDTRRIEPDSIFFALRGDTFDGNRFVAEALEKGAAYAVSDDPQVAASDERQRIVLVDDTLKALQDLARCHRRALGIPILAISGSNGKTTTKELVSRVLAERFEVYATRGNLNNHIGVPLTLLAMTRDTEFGVVEMGASACGELALLASVAEPNYGILTNIGLAHLEGFGGPEGVRRGKGELFDFLAANGGHAFVPADDEILTGMAAERDSLAAEYYSASLADGIENHLEAATTDSTSRPPSPWDAISTFPTNASATPSPAMFPTTTARSASERPATRSSPTATTPTRRACGLRSGIFSPSRSKSVSAGC